MTQYPSPAALQSRISVLETELSSVQAQIQAQMYISGAATANQNAQNVAAELRSKGYGVSISPAVRQGNEYNATVTITSVPPSNPWGYQVGYAVGASAPLEVSNPNPNTARLNELYAQENSINSQLNVLWNEYSTAEAETTPPATSTAATSPETTTAAPTNEEYTTSAPTSSEPTTVVTPPLASRWFAAFVAYLSFGDSKL